MPRSCILGSKLILVLPSSKSMTVSSMQHKFKAYLRYVLGGFFKFKANIVQRKPLSVAFQKQNADSLKKVTLLR